jgi:hypothetical protein
MPRSTGPQKSDRARSLASRVLPIPFPCHVPLSGPRLTESGPGLPSPLGRICRDSLDKTACPVPTSMSVPAWWGSGTPLCENGSHHQQILPSSRLASRASSHSVTSNPVLFVSRPINGSVRTGPGPVRIPSRPFSPWTLDVSRPDRRSGGGSRIRGSSIEKNNVTQPPVFPPILFRRTVFRSTAPGAQRVRSLQ